MKKKGSILDEIDDAGIKFVDGSDAQNAKIVQGLLDLVQRKSEEMELRLPSSELHRRAPSSRQNSDHEHSMTENSMRNALQQKKSPTNYQVMKKKEDEDFQGNESFESQPGVPGFDHS